MKEGNSIVERKRKLGRVVLNKNPLEKSEGGAEWLLLTGDLLGWLTSCGRGHVTSFPLGGLYSFDGSLQ